MLNHRFSSSLNTLQVSGQQGASNEAEVRHTFCACAHALRTCSLLQIAAIVFECVTGTQAVADESHL